MPWVLFVNSLAVIGYWLSVICYWSVLASFAGYWLSVICYWFSLPLGWLLVIYYRLLLEMTNDT